MRKAILHIEHHSGRRLNQCRRLQNAVTILSAGGSLKRKFDEMDRGVVGNSDSRKSRAVSASALEEKMETLREKKQTIDDLQFDLDFFLRVGSENEKIKYLYDTMSLREMLLSDTNENLRNMINTYGGEHFDEATRSYMDALKNENQHLVTMYRNAIEELSKCDSLYEEED